MKKILIVLTMIGMIHQNANAQAQKTKRSSYNSNYSICNNLAGYFVCSNNQLRVQNQRSQVRTEPIALQAQVINMESTTDVNDKPGDSYISPYRYHKFILGDKMNNPANGLQSQQYDGPAKNEERNMNYNQTSIHLAPSDGNNSK